MPRFENHSKPEWEKREELDRAYTYLHYMKGALEKCGDYKSASIIQNIEQDYRMKGATLRYQYAPMN